MKNQLSCLTLERVRSRPDTLPEIKLEPTARIAQNYGVQSGFGEIFWIPGSPSRSSSPENMPAVVQSVGDLATLAGEEFRTAGGSLARWLIDHRTTSACLYLGSDLFSSQPSHLQAYLEGALLGAYFFSEFRTQNLPEPVRIILFGGESNEMDDCIQRAVIVAEAVNYSRSIAQQPPNIINPATLAEEARELSEEAGLLFERIDHESLTAMGAGAIVSVGQGSKTPSELIVLEHPGRGEMAARPPVVLVGKAITFDTGGYAIKKLYGMASMKYDKSGGAVVMGVMKGVAALNPGRRVIGLVAAAENMISGKAYRPNDIIRSLSGHTVEIISTDAEGRLVLADALTYACRKYRPAALVDVATLTGGAYTALGSVRAGLLTNDRALGEGLLRAGDKTHERLWELPLDDDYFELIRGKDSDLINSFHHPEGASVPASTIMGGMFLKQFIEDGYSWAHIDIAATAKSSIDRPYTPRGATGFGVRLLLDFIENLS